jgi:hypothetical protein
MKFLINQFHTYTKLLTIRFLDVAKRTTPTQSLLFTSCELSFPSVALKISSLQTLGLKSPNTTDKIRVLVPLEAFVHIICFIICWATNIQNDITPTLSRH